MMILERKEPQNLTILKKMETFGTNDVSLHVIFIDLATLAKGARVYPEEVAIHRIAAKLTDATEITPANR